MTFNFFVDPGCTDLYKDPGMLLRDPVLRTPGSGLYITDQESRINSQQPSTTLTACCCRMLLMNQGN